MIRSIIIDDEEESRNVLQDILRDSCRQVRVVASAWNVESGLKVIREHHPDLVFLDIQLVDGTGFDLLEQLQEIPFQVIFITAYDQYALQAIKCSALDYILKPIDPFQVVDAVHKLENRNPPEIFAKQIQTLFGNKNGFERISVPTLDGLRFILLNDILQCEADDNYTFFYLAGGERLLITRTLKEYEEILSDLGFIRVHHSHLVNSKYIERYIKGEGGTVILSDGSRIEVSRRRKAEFLRYLSERILGK